MPEIKEALVTVYASKESLQQLAAALAPAKVTYCLPYGPGAQEKIKEACKTCDVAIFNGDYDEAILDNPIIKWIHCCRAGLDKSAKPEIFERGIILTSSSGRSAPALAEHAIMFMLAMTYDLPKLYRCQQQHQWNATREYSQRTSMIKKTLGIVGLGKTGHEVLKLAQAFDMRILAYDRSHDTDYVGTIRVYLRTLNVLTASRQLHIHRNTLIYRMVDCRVQTARKRKGMEFHPCKSVGMVEYGEFAKTIDSRFTCECISCYPEITDDTCCCSWKFTLQEE